MGSEWDGQQVNAEEHAGNPAIAIPDDGFLSYYRDDMENAGGLKVKWKIRVATGPEAARLDARQAAAIREL
ncbi:MAG TPA: hypothetical protein VF933_06930, partial [Streptosporangiaceae bacterium]